MTSNTISVQMKPLVPISSGSTDSKNATINPNSDIALLARFPLGPPAELRDAERMKDLSFTLYQHKDEKKAAQRVLVADSEHVEYAGKNYGDQSYKLNARKFAIGFLNPSSNSCSLLPVHHIYNLLPHVKTLTHDYSNPLAGTEDDPYATRQKLLIDSFGSKKRRSQLASRESNRVIVQGDIASTLESALDNNTSEDRVTMSEAEVMKATKESLLPPFDDQTDEARKIYPVKRMIGDAEYEDLKNVAKGMQKLSKDETALKKAEDETKLSSFVVYRLKEINSIPDANKQRLIAIVLSYIQMLLNFKNGGVKNPKRSIRSLSLSPSLESSLLRNFTTLSISPSNPSQPHYNHTPGDERKLSCYFAVATLIAADFTLKERDLELICNDWRKERKDIIQLYKEVGCSGNQREMKLTAPLKLQTFRKKRKSAGR